MQFFYFNGLNFSMERSAYCSANLEEGFKLLQSGHSIAEASKMSGVPRTTLYSKARNCGVICLRESSKKYSEEQIEQAVKAVISNCLFLNLHNYANTFVYQTDRR
jgi:transposase